MNINEYANIISECDKARKIVGDTVAEQVIETITATVDETQRYCEANIDGFKERGAVTPIVKYEDGVINSSIEIYYDGDLNEQQAEFVQELVEKIQETGWNEYDD